jgi:APA family basic amino acid/polyamine antiporter
MLGVGIFLAPPIVAQHLTTKAPFFLMWLFGGVVALAGAVAFAELGTALPLSGGDFVIQKEALGPAVAYASGWVLFGAVFCGSIAMLAVAVCQYQLPVLLGVNLKQALFFVGTWRFTGIHLGALTLLLLFTLLNIAGGKVSGSVQTWLTIVPTAVFALLAIALLVGAPEGKQIAAPGRDISVWGLLVAYDAIYFTYSGWPNIIYVAGEVEKPSRNIPLSLLGGTSFVTLLYLLICVAFVVTLGMGGLAKAGEAGTATAMLLFGKMGGVVFAVVILLAILASVNATILGGARILYAMAQSGGSSKAGALSGKSQVPIRALWIQTAWTALLILSGGFVQLLQMASVAMFITGSLTVLSLFVLRTKRPELARPYRATGYPLLPAFYLLASLLACGFTVAKALQPKGSAYPLIGAGIFVLAFVAYRVFARRVAR